MINGPTRSGELIHRGYFLLLAGVFLTGCGDTPVSPLTFDGTQSSTVDSPAVEVAQAEAAQGAELDVIVLPVASSDEESAPIRYTVHKRAISKPQSSIPPVLLSGQHKKLCKANVGDTMPGVSLPRMNGATTELKSLFGEQATVILFWRPDRWMARTALIDMQRDIAQQFDARQVSVVGIAVGQARGNVQASLNEAQASFPQLLDTDVRAFAHVGTVALPRIYVLNQSGKIVWFDIEYSEGTRRELWQTLQVLTAE